MKRLWLRIASLGVGLLVVGWALPASPGRCPGPGRAPASILKRLSQGLSKAFGVPAVVWAQDPCVASCSSCGSCSSCSSCGACASCGACSCSCGCSCGCGCYGGCWLEA